MFLMPTRIIFIYFIFDCISQPQPPILMSSCILFLFVHYSLGLFPVITSKHMFQSHNNFWQHKKPHGGLLCCGQRPHRTAAHIDRAIWFNDQGTYSRNKPVTICCSQILYCEISHTSNWRQFTTSLNVYAHIIVRGHVPVYICVCLWVCLGQRGC